MSDDDPTKTLPSADPAQLKTQPSITAVFDLIQEVKRTVDSNAARLSAVELQIRETKDLADRRHAEILELFKGVRDDIGAARDEIAVLAHDTVQVRGSQRELRRRIEDLESKAS